MDYVATFPWTGWQKSVEYAFPSENVTCGIIQQLLLEFLYEN